MKSHSACNHQVTKQKTKPFQRWPLRLTTGIKHVLSVISHHAIIYSFTVLKHNKTKAKKLNSHSGTCTLPPFPFDLFQWSENRASLRAPRSSWLTAFPATALRAWQTPTPGQEQPQKKHLSKQTWTKCLKQSGATHHQSLKKLPDNTITGVESTQ